MSSRPSLLDGWVSDEPTPRAVLMIASLLVLVLLLFGSLPLSAPAGARAISRFGCTAIDLALDPLQLPPERLAYPDLKSVSPDGEVLCWECETGKVQRTPAERNAQWAAHCELNHNHFYVFLPTNEAQKNVVSEINLWLDEHRPLQVWLALCQYAKAMRADKPTLWAINSMYMVE